MQTGFYWSNKPTIVSTTQIHFDNNWLLHQMSEAQALKNCTIDAIIKFLEEHIITRFGCAHALVCDNGYAFTSLRFSNWAFDYYITLKFSSNYYSHGNGLAESTNKSLLSVIKKLLEKRLAHSIEICSMGRQNESQEILGHFPVSFGLTNRIQFSLSNWEFQLSSLCKIFWIQKRVQICLS